MEESANNIMDRPEGYISIAEFADRDGISFRVLRRMVIGGEIREREIREREISKRLVAPIMEYGRHFVRYFGKIYINESIHIIRGKIC